MIILPIAHEEGTVRRWPVVTIGIIAINVALLVYSMIRIPADLTVLDNKLLAASHFARDRPWARDAAPPGCVSFTGDPRLDESSLRGFATTSRAPEIGSVEDNQDKAEMKKLCAAVEVAREGSFLHRYGFVPAVFAPHTLLTHQFLHGGVLHLAFNLWFLWLCGCNLEDRWGRVVFPIFYLSGGALAALAHKLLATDVTLPMIGASGAVSAAMGAFLAIFGRTKINFFYLFAFGFRIRTGRFEATAYWMLPLWLASELFSAIVLKHTNDGVAHWAHVGGFAVGLMVGLGMKFSGADAKLDAKQEESLTVLRQNPEMADAAALVDEGRYPEAIAKLEALASLRPDDVDVQVELLRAATLARDTHRRQRASARLLILYVNQGFADAAADLYKEIRLNQMEDGVPRATAFVVGEGLARARHADVASLVYRRVRKDGLVDELAVRAAVGEASALMALGRKSEARALLEECKASPFSTAELDARVDALLMTLGPAAIAM